MISIFGSINARGGPIGLVIMLLNLGVILVYSFFALFRKGDQVGLPSSEGLFVKFS